MFIVIVPVLCYKPPLLLSVTLFSLLQVAPVLQDTSEAEVDDTQ